MKSSKIIVAFHVGRGGRFYNPGNLTFIGEQKISHFTSDLFLNEDETEYVDGAGNYVGLTVEEEKTGIGRINIDNEYDTTYTRSLFDCSFKEIMAIKESKEWNAEDLIKTFLEDCGYETFEDYEFLNNL
jgi:hypothetical protein